MTITRAPDDTQTQTTIDAIRRERDELMLKLDQRQCEAVERCAWALAKSGVRTIALFGAGPHTRAFAREPWEWAGLRVAAILDDRPTVDEIDGVPVARPMELREAIDAIVVSSEGDEPGLHRAACRSCAPLDRPIHRIYGEGPDVRDERALIDRLVHECGVDAADAEWLVANRWERHDATLPMLHHSRTTLHKRRYRFAADVARARLIDTSVIADIACGTGYGTGILHDILRPGTITGVDVDERAIAYARRRHGRGRSGVEFRAADARSTGIESASCGLIGSFETIEHLPDPGPLLVEFARVLRPGGVLVVSTPNDTGLTDYHEVSYTAESFRDALGPVFREVELFGQVAANVPRLAGFQPGIFPLDRGSPRPHTIIGVARGARV